MPAGANESLPSTASVSSLQSIESLPGIPVTVADFDFANKLVRSCSFEEACAAIEVGRFVWIDVDATNPAEALRVFEKLKLVDPQTIDSALKGEPSTQCSRFDDYIHLVVSGCRQRGGKFDLERVDAVIAERFFLTLHKGPVAFLSGMRRDYRSDFLRFARSPSFLVYELWDHLIDNYLSVQKVMEERVEELQREATQPFLANMVGTLEHVLQDLLVDRDILSESLNLYMSVVSHRTNAVMNRLTVVSVVFLPLTFLCGVYGMNFDILPELHWTRGYLFFWLAVVAIAAGLITFLRRARLL